MTTEYNFTKIAGDSESITVTVLDETGAAVSLVGGVVKYVIKTDVRAVTNILLLTSATSAITISTNTTTIALTPTNTATLAGEYYHECEVTLADGRVFTAFTGRLIINPTGV
jgi:hypothetical protein